MTRFTFAKYVTEVQPIFNFCICSMLYSMTKKMIANIYLFLDFPKQNSIFANSLSIKVTGGCHSDKLIFTKQKGIAYSDYALILFMLVLYSRNA